jgi:hypothetical protein
MRIPDRYIFPAAVLFPAMVCWLIIPFAIYVSKTYGWTIFFVLPIFIGIFSTYLYQLREDNRLSGSFSVSATSLFVTGIGLLLFAFEGVICLIMASPLALLLTYFGYCVWYYWKPGNASPAARRMMMPALFGLLPVSLFVDRHLPAPQLYAVSSSIVINASPKAVWQNVVQFPQLPEPEELMFKTGIAYPINATIKGTGAGAIRYCNFSTGPFVEPITIWNEPHLLQFSVTQQPAPMKELSPFNINPPHLDGFWTSEKGQFALTALPDGSTLLTGTTWYRNRIAPVMYWNVWADYIVHTIHLRVLTHIKAETEKAG